MNATAVARHESAEIVQTDGASLMDVIARAANDPNTDVDKLERLMGLYERITGRQAEQAFNEAMNAAQEEMHPIAADANNPQTKSKYASYPALDRAVRPIYVRHGFSLSFNTDDSQAAEHVRVVCRVAHKDGYSRDHHVDMPSDGKGAKGGDVMTKTHAVGAAMSYGQRYLLKLIFNIAVGDDDDGNSNGGRDMSTAFQKAVAEINSAETLAALKAWKAKTADGLQRLLRTDEWNEVVSLTNRRVTALKAKAEA